MDLFYCLDDMGYPRVLVGHVLEEGQEDVFRDIFLDENSRRNLSAGVFFGPKIVTSFVQYATPLQVKRAPVSGLCGYQNNPRKWLKFLADDWSAALMSDVARDLFIPNVLGSLCVETVRVLSVQEIAKEDS